MLNVCILTENLGGDPEIHWISNESIQKSNFQILVNTIEFIKINSHESEQSQTSDDDLPF